MPNAVSIRTLTDTNALFTALTTNTVQAFWQMPDQIQVQAAAVPQIQYGVESQLPWLHVNTDLPREETARNEKLAQMTVFQFGGTMSHG